MESHFQVYLHQGVFIFAHHVSRVGIAKLAYRQDFVVKLLLQRNWIPSTSLFAAKTVQNFATICEMLVAIVCFGIAFTYKNMNDYHPFNPNITLDNGMADSDNNKMNTTRNDNNVNPLQHLQHLDNKDEEQDPTFAALEQNNDAQDDGSNNDTVELKFKDSDEVELKDM